MPDALKTQSTGAGDRMPDAIDRENTVYRQSIFASGTLGAVGDVIRRDENAAGAKIDNADVRRV